MRKHTLKLIKIADIPVYIGLKDTTLLTNHWFSVLEEFISPHLTDIQTRALEVNTLYKDMFDSPRQRLVQGFIWRAFEALGFELTTLKQSECPTCALLIDVGTLHKFRLAT